MAISAYPEWLERQDLPVADRPWNVQAGSPTRGDAWTDISNKRMCIPVHDDETARVIRAHEMVHAKISPACGAVIPDGYSLKAAPMATKLVVGCEEARVNYVASAAGFDMKHLTDGSEKTSGYRTASTGNPNYITLDLVAMYGTGAFNQYMNGIRKAVNEGKANKAILTHAYDVKNVLARQLRDWKKYASVSSTTPMEVVVGGESIEVPKGYMNTIRLATVLSSLMISEEAKDGVPGMDTIPTGSTGGRFAPPIVQKLPLTERVAGRMNRKRIATNIGTNPRRMSRMLTDPERRVFDRRARDIGGIVLIDQSGSMHLSQQDVWDIIKASPGCVVIGYSHSAGSTTTPNIWVIAERGRVANEMPNGNGGNGVDGPALMYALSKRRNNEPFIWVCDGYVTDFRDNCHENLNTICRDIVIKHGIHMVPDVDGATAALKSVSRGARLSTNLVGVLKRG